MKKFLSLIISIVLLCSLMNIGVWATGESTVSSVQNYEETSIVAKSGAISSLRNHTKGGSKSVKLTSEGYKQNYQLPQAIITDSLGDAITAKANETYVFTAYVYTEKTGGDDVKFKILNTNTNLSYASGDLLYEKKGVTLKENQWVKISFLFTTGETLSKSYMSFGMTANKETTDNYIDTDDYYIDDVSLISVSELNSSAVVTSPNKVGLYHNVTLNSSIYTEGGTEYSSFRVYGKYKGFSGNVKDIDYYGTHLTIEERGILVSEYDRVESEFLIDSEGVRKGFATGNELSDFWDYNYASNKVTYSVILSDISYANKDLTFAIRPYVKVSFDNDTLLIYGDIQRGNDNSGFSLQSIYDSAKSDLNNPTWFDGSLDATELSLYKNGLTSRYTIVRPATMSNEMLKSTLDFYSEFNESFDGGIKIKTDAESTTQYEILIGETNRSESTSAYSELEGRSDADYIIKIDGRKIVIAANSAYALERALNEFKDSTITSRKTVSKTLNCGYTCNSSAIKTASSGYTIAPNASASNDFTIHTPEYPSYFTMEAARTLADYVQHKTGVTLSIVKDGVSTAARSFYICNTEDSNLTDSQYSVTFVGSVIKLDAGSENALFAGLSALTNVFDKGESIPAAINGSIAGNNSILPNNYSLSWNDEFDGTNLNTAKWRAMTDVTSGPWYTTSESYYTTSQNSSQWITGNYIAASFTDNTGSIDYDTSKADKSLIGDDMIFFDNIDSDYVSSLTTVVTTAGGKILVSGTVDSGYAQEGIQVRPSAEGTTGTYYVSDGKLHEITSKTNYGYDAVRVATDSTMDYRYGMTETRMTVATNNGACSAVWTSKKDVNEIDVYENAGEDKFRANLHTYQPEHIEYIATEYMDILDVYPKSGSHFYDTYHYIGYEWTDSYIAFYLDGDITQIVDITNSTFDGLRDATSLRIANGVGTDKYSIGSNPGNKMGIGAVNFREEQIIDYVRIYQKKDTLSKLTIKK